MLRGGIDAIEEASAVQPRVQGGGGSSDHRRWPELGARDARSGFVTESFGSLGDSTRGLISAAPRTDTPDINGFLT